MMLCTSTWWCTLLRVLGWQTCALGSRVARPLLGAALRSEPTQRPATRRGARWSRGAKLATPAAGARVARAVRGSALLLASRNQNVIEDHHGKRSRAILPLAQLPTGLTGLVLEAGITQTTAEPELCVAGQGCARACNGPGPRELAVPIDREIFGLP